MECQNMIKHLKINKNKQVGKVIIIVEGEDEEHKLLKHIFTKVLNYNYVSIRRGREQVKTSSKSNSHIIVINTANSSIKSVMEDKDYKDKLYQIIKKEYNSSLKNVPIYILWDRDVDTNDDSVVLKTLDTFYSALDNEYDMNGLLLLSYPCLESFELSNFDKKFWKKKFYTSKEAKKQRKNIRPTIHEINENSLLLALENTHRTMNFYGIKKYDSTNFHKENIKIYKKEMEVYDEYKYFDALSLIGIMLVDLGIIEEK